VFDKNIAKQMESEIRTRYPEYLDLPRDLFIEVTYFMYYCKYQFRLNPVQVYDVADLYSDNFEALSNYIGDKPLQEFICEVIIKASADHFNAVQSVFYNYNLSLFRPCDPSSIDEREIAFLEKTKVVKLVISNQPDTLYNIVMGQNNF
jgi:hypothetical protein